jgi:hypothetical protein
MYTSNLSIPIIAGEDLSLAACEYHAVASGGMIAANAGSAIGVLVNRPKANEDATVGVMGRFRFRAGAAVTAYTRLRVTTSGWFISAVSGSISSGYALSAVSSGAIGEGVFNFGSYTQIT